VPRRTLAAFVIGVTLAPGCTDAPPAGTALESASQVTTVSGVLRDRPEGHPVDLDGAVT
jgi:hypothetical protein